MLPGRSVKCQPSESGIDLIDRVPDELWNEVRDIVQETGIKTIPMEKNCKKAKWLSGEALQIAVKRREVKGTQLQAGATRVREQSNVGHALSPQVPRVRPMGICRARCSRTTHGCHPLPVQWYRSPADQTQEWSASPSTDPVSHPAGALQILVNELN